MSTFASDLQKDHPAVRIEKELMESKSRGKIHLLHKIRQVWN